MDALNYINSSCTRTTLEGGGRAHVPCQAYIVCPLNRGQNSNVVAEKYFEFCISNRPGVGTNFFLCKSCWLNWLFQVWVYFWVISLAGWVRINLIFSKTCPEYCSDCRFLVGLNWSISGSCWSISGFHQNAEGAIFFVRLRSGRG